MASKTKKLKIRRQIRSATLGKQRKSNARNKGTTQPLLPLDVPNAHERAQAKKSN